MLLVKIPHALSFNSTYKQQYKTITLKLITVRQCKRMSWEKPHWSSSHQKITLVLAFMAWERDSYESSVLSYMFTAFTMRKYIWYQYMHPPSQIKMDSTSVFYACIISLI